MLEEIGLTDDYFKELLKTRKDYLLLLINSIISSAIKVYNNSGSIGLGRLLIGTLEGSLEISDTGILTEKIAKQGPSIGSNMIGQTLKIPYLLTNGNNQLYLTFYTADQNGTPLEYQEIYERVHIQ